MAHTFSKVVIELIAYDSGCKESFECGIEENIVRGHIKQCVLATYAANCSNTQIKKTRKMTKERKHIIPADRAVASKRQTKPLTSAKILKLFISGSCNRLCIKKINIYERNVLLF